MVLKKAGHDAVRLRVREHADRWKRQISEADSQRDRDYLVAMWMGYLNGLRMAGVITHGDYTELYDGMRQYTEGFEAAQEKAQKKAGPPAGRTAESPEHKNKLIPGL